MPTLIRFKVDLRPNTLENTLTLVDNFWSSQQPNTEKKFIVPFWQIEEAYEFAKQKNSDEIAIVLHNPSNPAAFKIEVIPFVKGVTQKKIYKNANIYTIPFSAYDAAGKQALIGERVIYLRFYKEVGINYPIILVQYSTKVKPLEVGAVGPNGSGDGYPLKGH